MRHHRDTFMKMTPKLEAEELKITEALEAMQNDPTLKPRAAVTRFGAPYRRLLARKNGCPPSST